MKFTVVPNEACPVCGAHPEHVDEALRFFNRPKVGDDDGNWWWRCYNPACEVALYLPETGQWEEAAPKEEYEAMHKQIMDEVEEHGILVTVYEPGKAPVTERVGGNG